MPYRSPVLDRRITLVHRRDTGERNSWNQPVGSILDPLRIQVWAARTDITGSERVVQSGIVANLRSKYIIRYRTDIDTSWRLQDQDQTSGIEAIRQVNRRRYLEILTNTADAA